MSLLTRAGITKLSELEIDADKDWAAHGISNIKEIAASMAKGDLAVRAASILQRLQPGQISYVLISAGPGHIPVWGPAGGVLEKWLPAWIELTHAQVTDTVDQSHEETAPITSSHVQTYGDAPADMIRLFSKSIALAKAATGGITPDKTHNENSTIASSFEGEIVVGGACAKDGAVYTDETAQAQSPAVNDMTLLPAVPAVGDAYYFGFSRVFDLVRLNIGTQGDGDWTIVWEYWNGAWTALAGVTDGTNHFRAIAGVHDVTFTRPGDWATTNEGGNLPADIYWVRARVSVYNSIITQPKGTQCWVGINQ